MIDTRHDNIVYLLGSEATFHTTADVAGEVAPAGRFRHHLIQLVINSGTPAVIIEGTLTKVTSASTPTDKHWFPIDTLNSSKLYTRLTNCCLTGVRARRADSSEAGVKVIYSGCGDLSDN